MYVWMDRSAEGNRKPAVTTANARADYEPFGPSPMGEDVAPLLLLLYVYRLTLLSLLFRLFSFLLFFVTRAEKFSDSRPPRGLRPNGVRAGRVLREGPNQYSNLRRLAQREKEREKRR